MKYIIAGIAISLIAVASIAVFLMQVQIYQPVQQISKNEYDRTQITFNCTNIPLNGEFRLAIYGTTDTQRTPCETVTIQSQTVTTHLTYAINQPVTIQIQQINANGVFLTTKTLYNLDINGTVVIGL